jgi:hypothetical protein
LLLYSYRNNLFSNRYKGFVRHGRQDFSQFAFLGGHSSVPTLFLVAFQVVVSLKTPETERTGERWVGHFDVLLDKMAPHVVSSGKSPWTTGTSEMT